MESLRMRNVHQDAAVRAQPCALSRMDDQRRVGLLDDGRAGDLLAGGQTSAIIDRCFDEAAPEIGLTMRDRGWRAGGGCAHPRMLARLRTMHMDSAQVDQLDGRAG